MSRLNYIQRTYSSEDVPRPVQLPASPPETELSGHLNAAAVPMDQETPGGRFRRLASSISYHHSALSNAARDATRPVGPRTSRWLVVVLPPQNLLREPAQLGHTLSTSPSGRFNNGILMPLFPTMYGQLTAIAREFGLPSVSGVCVYLHMEGGAAMAPRISDDTWSMLWGHLFDDMAQPTTGLPIGGRIEFDIDARKARWYNAWIGVHRGETIEHPIAESVSGHRRQASRTSIFGDEDLRSDNGLYPLHLTTSSRTVNRPRKLNLVQKPSDVVIPKPPTPPSESHTTQSVKRLSPVAQEEEPITAKLVEVDRKIMQWRKTSGVSPNPLSNKTGQISLDPAHMPNSAPGTPSKQEHIHGAEEDEELNLDDFAWSISSAGPQSFPPSPNWSERQASVHLEWRLRGSAPPTPSTASTGWPYDYPDSPVYSLTSRVPSLDIAQRMVESAPCTPTTATSWGAPSYAVSMLGEEGDSQSLDLGHRFSYSRPMTPSTATSWGPGSYAVSPMSEYYAQSLQLGQRLAESQPATPTTATSWGPGSYPPSPVMEEHVLTPGIADRVFDNAPLATRRASVSGLAFPYYIAVTPSPRGWNHVWPYTEHVEQEELASPVWNQVWPYNSPQVEEASAEPWPMVWPYRNLVRPQPAAVRLVGSDATYPIGSTSIYPATTLASKCLTVRLAPSYPVIDLYPAGYPSNLDTIYPSITAKVSVSAQAIVPVSSYPSLTIYAPMYPHFDIYPAPAACELTKPLPLPVDLAPAYPNLMIYRATYPSFDLYPSLSLSIDASSPVARANSNPAPKPMSVTLQKAYPEFDLYPAGYPHSLFTIYGHASKVSTKKTSSDAPEPITITLKASYPDFNLYPAGYPFNLAAIYGRPAAGAASRRKAVTVTAEQYPFVNGVYAHVYPYNLDCIYAPTVAVADPRTVICEAEAYPFANGVYAAVYPFNLASIYAPVAVAVDPQFVCVAAAYPFHFGIYPAVYPFNLDTIYAVTKVVEAPSACVAEGYPFLAGIYPAVYPYNLEYIYRPIQVERPSAAPVSHINYPFLEIYASVYPHITPYPPISGGQIPMREQTQASRHRRSITPPRGQVLRDISKTHAVRLSHSRRLSVADAPPVPRLPTHVRTSPASSRATSPITPPTIMEETRKTHKELHDLYFARQVSAKPRKTHAELHTAYFAAQEKHFAARTLPPLPQLDTSKEGVAGSLRSSTHVRRTSAALDRLVRQYSPEGVSATSTSTSPSSGRPVSRLDRSKFPFA